ncbi:unnamed protein product [Plutella xylostella]|uniref:(diamondback moth) hypothetical protein n=1 Tax=Plutella xylostella TaxID=51655 RepID=A0A8S4EI13_PLUXY|nr:uncharacterized protein YGR130C [Plutella xylostella]CAG9115614.1 unnamed protein product [Plutella xylostella]
MSNSQIRINTIKMNSNKYSRFLKKNLNTKAIKKNFRPSHMKSSITSRIRPIKSRSVKGLKRSYTKVVKRKKSKKNIEDDDYEYEYDPYEALEPRQMYQPQQIRDPNEMYNQQLYGQKQLEERRRVYEEKGLFGQQQLYEEKYGTPIQDKQSGDRESLETPTLSLKSESRSSSSSSSSSSPSSSSTSSASKASASPIPSPVASTSSKASSSSSKASSASKSTSGTTSSSTSIQQWRPSSITATRMAPSKTWLPTSDSSVFQRTLAPRKVKKKVSFNEEPWASVRHRDTKKRSDREPTHATFKKEAPIPKLTTSSPTPSEIKTEDTPPLVERPAELLKKQESFIQTQPHILIRKGSKFFRGRRLAPLDPSTPSNVIPPKPSLMVLFPNNSNILIPKHRPRSEPAKPASILKPPTSEVQFPSVSPVSTIQSLTVLMDNRGTDPAENSKNRSINTSGQSKVTSSKSSNTEKKKRKKFKKTKCRKPILEVETNVEWLRSYLTYKPELLTDELSQSLKRDLGWPGYVQIKKSEGSKLKKKKKKDEEQDRPKPTTNLDNLYTYMTNVTNSGSEPELYDPPKYKKKKKVKKPDDEDKLYELATTTTTVMFTFQDDDGNKVDVKVLKERQTSTKGKKKEKKKKKKVNWETLTLATNIIYLKSYYRDYCESLLRMEALKEAKKKKKKKKSQKDDQDHTETIDWHERAKIDLRVDRPTSADYLRDKGIIVDMHLRTFSKFEYDDLHGPSISYQDLGVRKATEIRRTFSFDRYHLFRTKAKAERCYTINRLHMEE